MTRPRRPGGLLRPRVPIWPSSDGPIHVYQMSHGHLLNALSCIERESHSHTPAISAKANMLRKELRRRGLWRPRRPETPETYKFRRAKVRRLEAVLLQHLPRESFYGYYEALRDLCALARGDR